MNRQYKVPEMLVSHNDTGLPADNDAECSSIALWDMESRGLICKTLYARKVV